MEALLLGGERWPSSADHVYLEWFWCICLCVATTSYLQVLFVRCTGSQLQLAHNAVIHLALCNLSYTHTHGCIATVCPQECQS